MRLVTRPRHEGFCRIAIGSEHVLDGLVAMTAIIAAQLASCGDGRRLRADTTRTPMPAPARAGARRPAESVQGGDPADRRARP